MHPHHVFWFIIITSILSGIICALIGSRKRIGSFMGGALGFAFGVLSFTFIFFLPGKGSTDVSDKAKRYKSMLEEGLISKSEYLNLTEMLTEEGF